MKERQTSYQIYGRKAYEKPLTLVRQLTLGAQQALEEAALKEVGVKGWIELVAIPHEAMIYVTREGKS